MRDGRKGRKAEGRRCCGRAGVDVKEVVMCGSGRVPLHLCDVGVGVGRRGVVVWKWEPR